MPGFSLDPNNPQDRSLINDLSNSRSNMYIDHFNDLLNQYRPAFDQDDTAELQNDDKEALSEKHNRHPDVSTYRELNPWNNINALFPKHHITSDPMQRFASPFIDALNANNPLSEALEKGINSFDIPESLLSRTGVSMGGIMSSYHGEAILQSIRSAQQSIGLGIYQFDNPYILKEILNKSSSVPTTITMNQSLSASRSHKGKAYLIAAQLTRESDKIGSLLKLGVGSVENRLKFGGIDFSKDQSVAVNSLYDHFKLLHTVGNNGFQSLVVGSANYTLAALGNTAKRAIGSSNYETTLYLHSGMVKDKGVSSELATRMFGQATLLLDRIQKGMSINTAINPDILSQKSGLIAGKGYPKAFKSIVSKHYDQITRIDISAAHMGSGVLSDLIAISEIKPNIEINILVGQATFDSKSAEDIKKLVDFTQGYSNIKIHNLESLFVHSKQIMFTFKTGQQIAMGGSHNTSNNMMEYKVNEAILRNVGWFMNSQDLNEFEKKIFIIQPLEILQRYQEQSRYRSFHEAGVISDTDAGMDYNQAKIYFEKSKGKELNILSNLLKRSAYWENVKFSPTQGFSFGAISLDEASRLDKLYRLNRDSSGITLSHKSGVSKFELGGVYRVGSKKFNLNTLTSATVAQLHERYSIKDSAYIPEFSKFITRTISLIGYSTEEEARNAKLAYRDVSPTEVIASAMYTLQQDVQFEIDKLVASHGEAEALRMLSSSEFQRMMRRKTKQRLAEYLKNFSGIDKGRPFFDTKTGLTTILFQTLEGRVDLKLTSDSTFDSHMLDRIINSTDSILLGREEMFFSTYKKQAFPFVSMSGSLGSHSTRSDSSSLAKVYHLPTMFDQTALTYRQVGKVDEDGNILKEDKYFMLVPPSKLGQWPQRSQTVAGEQILIPTDLEGNTLPLQGILARDSNFNLSRGKNFFTLMLPGLTLGNIYLKSNKFNTIGFADTSLRINTNISVDQLIDRTVVGIETMKKFFREKGITPIPDTSRYIISSAQASEWGFIPVAEHAGGRIQGTDILQSDFASHDILFDLDAPNFKEGTGSTLSSKPGLDVLTVTGMIIKRAQSNSRLKVALKALAVMSESDSLLFRMIDDVLDKVDASLLGKTLKRKLKDSYEGVHGVDVVKLGATYIETGLQLIADSDFHDYITNQLGISEVELVEARNLIMDSRSRGLGIRLGGITQGDSHNKIIELAKDIFSKHSDFFERNTTGIAEAFSKDFNNHGQMASSIIPVFTNTSFSATATIMSTRGSVNFLEYHAGGEYMSTAYELMSKDISVANTSTNYSELMGRTILGDKIGAASNIINLADKHVFFSPIYDHIPGLEKETIALHKLMLKQGVGSVYSNQATRKLAMRIYRQVNKLQTGEATTSFKNSVISHDIQAVTSLEETLKLDSRTVVFNPITDSSRIIRINIFSPAMLRSLGAVEDFTIEVQKAQVEIMQSLKRFHSIHHKGFSSYADYEFYSNFIGKALELEELQKATTATGLQSILGGSLKIKGFNMIAGTLPQIPDGVAVIGDVAYSELMSGFKESLMKQSYDDLKSIFSKSSLSKNFITSLENSSEYLRFERLIDHATSRKERVLEYTKKLSKEKGFAFDLYNKSLQLKGIILPYNILSTYSEESYLDTYKTANGIKQQFVEGFTQEGLGYLKGLTKRYRKRGKLAFKKAVDESLDIIEQVLNLRNTNFFYGRGEFSISLGHKNSLFAFVSAKQKKAGILTNNLNLAIKELTKQKDLYRKTAIVDSIFEDPDSRSDLVRMAFQRAGAPGGPEALMALKVMSVSEYNALPDILIKLSPKEASTSLFVFKGAMAVNLGDYDGDTASVAWLRRLTDLRIKSMLGKLEMAESEELLKADKFVNTDVRIQIIRHARLYAGMANSIDFSEDSLKALEFGLKSSNPIEVSDASEKLSVLHKRAISANEYVREIYEMSQDIPAMFGKKLGENILPQDFTEENLSKLYARGKSTLSKAYEAAGIGLPTGLIGYTAGQLQTVHAITSYASSMVMGKAFEIFYNTEVWSKQQLNLGHIDSEEYGRMQGSVLMLQQMAREAIKPKSAQDLERAINLLEERRASGAFGDGLAEFESVSDIIKESPYYAYLNLMSMAQVGKELLSRDMKVKNYGNKSYYMVDEYGKTIYDEEGRALVEEGAKLDDSNRIDYEIERAVESHYEFYKNTNKTDPNTIQRKQALLGETYVDGTPIAPEEYNALLREEYRQNILANIALEQEKTHFFETRRDFTTSLKNSRTYSEFRSNTGEINLFDKISLTAAMAARSKFEDPVQLSFAMRDIFESYQDSKYNADYDKEDFERIVRMSVKNEATVKTITDTYGYFLQNDLDEKIEKGNPKELARAEKLADKMANEEKVRAAKVAEKVDRLIERRKDRLISQDQTETSSYRTVDLKANSIEMSTRTAKDINKAAKLFHTILTNSGRNFAIEGKPSTVPEFVGIGAGLQANVIAPVIAMAGSEASVEQATTVSNPYHYKEPVSNFGTYLAGAVGSAMAGFIAMGTTKGMLSSFHNMDSGAEAVHTAMAVVGGIAATHIATPHLNKMSGGLKHLSTGMVGFLGAMGADFLMSAAVGLYNGATKQYDAAPDSSDSFNYMDENFANFEEDEESVFSSEITHTVLIEDSLGNLVENYVYSMASPAASDSEEDFGIISDPSLSLLSMSTSFDSGNEEYVHNFTSNDYLSKDELSRFG